MSIGTKMQLEEELFTKVLKDQINCSYQRDM